MTTSTLLFLVLASLAISIQSIEYEGISRYCAKSRLYPFWYISPPVECCNEQGTCDLIIGPEETKYGLTNTDPQWIRRHCNCDLQLYLCVTQHMKVWEQVFAMAWGLRNEKCFAKTLELVDGTWENAGTQFWSLLDTLPTQQARPDIKRRLM